MSISVTDLTNGFDSAGVTSEVTASITPGANHLLLVAVYNVVAAGTANIPTATGNGLTWVQVATVPDIGNLTRRVTVLRALGASPSAGAVTIDFAGQTQLDIIWDIVDVAGVDTSGADGAGAVVQSATNQVGTAGITVTLAAFAAATNGCAGFFARVDSLNEGFGVGAGFTQAAQINHASKNNTLLSEWRVDNDTTVDATMVTASQSGGIAIELQAAAAAPGGWSVYRPYTLGSAIAALTTGGLFYYWRRRKQEKPDE